jgi:hypothetical protein
LNRHLVEEVTQALVTANDQNKKDDFRSNMNNTEVDAGDSRVDYGITKLVMDIGYIRIEINTRKLKAFHCFN